jgi:hypothetical protein
MVCQVQVTESNMLGAIGTMGLLINTYLNTQTAVEPVEESPGCQALRGINNFYFGTNSAVAIV